jgi:hypothetical protein
MKKRISTLLALAAASLAVVISAQAGVTTNEQLSFAYAGYVPCANGGAGELLTGTIDVHDLASETAAGNQEAWQFTFERRGELVGRVTGDTYRLAGVEHGAYTQSADTDQATLTYVNRYLLVGPGPGNNLTVRETAHVTVDADENVIVQRDDFTVDCE